jgi:hypothetical protein
MRFGWSFRRFSCAGMRKFRVPSAAHRRQPLPIESQKGRETAIVRPIGNGSVGPYSLSSTTTESPSWVEGLTRMLDKPEKTRELMAILEAAAPFEVARPD